MATVELRFSALPAHVRTARLVAAAVARRSGVDESVLDEVPGVAHKILANLAGRVRELDTKIYG